jgi:hypothetical protein
MRQSKLFTERTSNKLSKKLTAMNRKQCRLVRALLIITVLLKPRRWEIILPGRWHLHSILHGPKEQKNINSLCGVKLDLEWCWATAVQWGYLYIWRGTVHWGCAYIYWGTVHWGCAYISWATLHWVCAYIFWGTVHWRCAYIYWGAVHWGCAYIWWATRETQVAGNVYSRRNPPNTQFDSAQYWLDISSTSPVVHG